MDHEHDGRRAAPFSTKAIFGRAFSTPRRTPTLPSVGGGAAPEALAADMTSATLIERINQLCAQATRPHPKCGATSPANPLFHALRHGREARVAALERLKQPTLVDLCCASLASCLSSCAPAPALRIIITGAPASGKGTQCERLVEVYGLVHLSTGDILRAAVKAGTAIGLTAKGYMERGELVPDEVIIDVVVARLGESDCRERGWLLDGFPRTAGQAAALHSAGIEPTHVIGLDVPDDELVQRVVNRRLDPVTGKIYNLRHKLPEDKEVVARLTQRADDTEEAVRVRLATFHKNTQALSTAYPMLVRIDGTEKPDVVFAVVQRLLQPSQ